MEVQEAVKIQAERRRKKRDRQEQRKKNRKSGKEVLPHDVANPDKKVNGKADIEDKASNIETEAKDETKQPSHPTNGMESKNEDSQTPPVPPSKEVEVIGGQKCEDHKSGAHYLGPQEIEAQDSELDESEDHTNGPHKDEDHKKEALKSKNNIRELMHEWIDDLELSKGEGKILKKLFTAGEYGTKELMLSNKEARELTKAEETAFNNAKKKLKREKILFNGRKIRRTKKGARKVNTYHFCVNLNLYREIKRVYKWKAKWVYKDYKKMTTKVEQEEPID